MACASFCQKSSGMVPDVSRLLQDKLRLVVSECTSAKFACIIKSNSGNLLSAYSPDELLNIDIVTAISELKRTVGQFALTMNLIGCPSLFLTGESYKFSCYELGSGFLLVFYEEIRDRDAKKSEDYVTMLKTIVDELRLILQNLVSPATLPPSPTLP